MSLLRRSILHLASRRWTSTIGSNPQGTQDDPSFAGTFVPDFTFPQGLQGDLVNGKPSDAICQLWLEKCKSYGYDNCEERLQEIFDANSIRKI